MNLFVKRKSNTGMENKGVDASRGRGGGRNWELGTDICTLWILRIK